MMAIIISGIDLTVGSIIALSGCVTVKAIVALGIPVFWAVILGCFVGALSGLITGCIIGSGYLGFIPLPVVYTGCLLLLTWFILNRTRLGRHIYAVGGNREAARFSGINIKRVQIFVYTYSGCLAAFAGIVLASRMASGQPAVGVGYETDAVAASVLGGASMTGGVGTIGGLVIGALVIGILSNGLNLLGVNSFWQYIAKGVVILIAVYIDMFRKRKQRF